MKVLGLDHKSQALGLGKKSQVFSLGFGMVFRLVTGSSFGLLINQIWYGGIV